MKQDRAMLYGATAIMVIAGQSSQSSAQNTSAAPSGALDPAASEIIVTAQRRAERLQDVPIAVSVVSGEQATTRGISDIKSLSAAVPNLTIVRNSNAINMYIRGVGKSPGNANVEGSVAVYVDGVYQPTPASASTFALATVERIEVLKGPQGTLFGRNATGGVVQIVTRDPTQDFEGMVSVGYGNYTTDTESGYISGGLTANLAANISFFHENQRDGFGINLPSGTKNFSGEEGALRAKLLFTPMESSRLTLIGDYSKSDLKYAAFQTPPGLCSIDGNCNYVGDFNSNSSVPPLDITKQYGIALRYDQAIGDIDFVSISALRHLASVFTLDGDKTPLVVQDLYFQEKTNSFSQEVQLMGNKNPSLTWLVGAYYFSARPSSVVRTEGVGGQPPRLPPPYAFNDTFGTQKSESTSVFGQMTSEIFSATKLTLGLRYTNESQKVFGRRTFSSGATPVLFPEKKLSFDRLTWRISLDRDITRDVHAYLSYNRGINTGGFSITNPGAAGAGPEQLDAYEVGLKSQLFDRRLRLNVAAFYYDFKDKVVSTRDPVTAQPANINAGAAEIYGLDADLQFQPTDRLTFTGTIGLLHSEYTRFPDAQVFDLNPGPPRFINARGERLESAPTFTGSGSIDYKMPVSFGEVAWNGTVVHSSYQTRFITLKLPSYTLVNSSLSLSFDDDRYRVRLWGKNLFDERYLAFGNTPGNGTLTLQGDPRTYGVALEYKW